MSALGFDLGGTQVRAALVEGGQVLRRAALRTDVTGGPEAVMEQFLRLGESVADKAAPVAVGIAAPGPLDTVTGVVDHIPTLPGWESFALRDRLAHAFGLPAVVENDGIAAAQGEWRHGAGRGLAHLVYVTVSTGVGGGVVVDGRLLHGRRGMAGHVGHMRVAEDGPVCSCGRVGCFEALASGTAFGRRADGGAEAVARARQGDPAALSLLAEEARLLGRGFANLAHLYAPERIIMGGGVAQAFDLLAPRIRAEFDAEAMPPFRTVEIVPAALGDNAGLIGAADLALQGNAG